MWISSTTFSCSLYPNQGNCAITAVLLMVRGGQNAVCVIDPCQMTSPIHILPHLCRNGWSAVVNFSKYFHMFPTKPLEWDMLGIIHMRTGKHYFYARYPMGTKQSLAASGWLGACFLHIIMDACYLCQGRPFDNTLQGFIVHKIFDPKLGEGWVLIDDTGEPVLLMWLHVDDLLLLLLLKELAKVFNIRLSV